MKGSGTHTSSVNRRLRPVLGVLVTLCVVSAGVGPAAAAPVRPAGEPDAAARVEKELAKHGATLRTGPAQAVERCTLRPSAHHGVGEAPSCLSVNATLSTVPAIGQRVTLRLVVSAQVARPDTEISVELPANLRFAEPPAGMRVSRTTSAAPDSGGHLTRAVIRRNLAAGARLSYTATVVPVAAGTARIHVLAKGGKAGGDAGYDSIFLTIGRPGTASRAGITVRPAPADPRPGGPGELSRPFSDDRRSGISTQATACVQGSFQYTDTAGAQRPARYWQVEAWDGDTFSQDDRLAIGQTDDNGGYRLCFGNGDESGGQDVWMVFRAQNRAWAMNENVNRGRYAYKTGQRDNIPDNRTTTMGQPSVPAAEMLGVQAYDEVADAWRFVDSGGPCWNGTPSTACKQIQVIWNPTAVWQGKDKPCGQASDCYITSSDTVLLAAETPRFSHVVAHEIGHAVMDDAYRDNFPATTNCSPHFVRLSSSPTCAWTEGFADWFAVATYGETTLVLGPGVGIDLENTTWRTPGWNDGEDVEGRVAGALLDLADPAGEPPWDRWGEGVGGIWQTLRAHVSSTFRQFWDEHRRADGLPVDDGDVRAAIYQNTIFVGPFYDPLSDYAERNVLADGVLEGYRFDTTARFWSVIAVRPPDGGSNTNLFVSDDPGTNFLKTSGRPGSAVDLVAIDSNNRPLGDHYAWVLHPEHGPVGGQYQIEHAQGLDQLVADSTQSLSFGADDVVAVRDVFMNAGQTSRFLVFAAPDQDLEMYVMQSDPGDQGTWVRNTDEAAASSNMHGKGGFEDITFTAPAEGFYGLVLVNAAGSGTATLQRFG